MLSLPDCQRRADPPRKTKKRLRRTQAIDDLLTEMGKLNNWEQTLTRRITQTAMKQAIAKQRCLERIDHLYLERMMGHLFQRHISAAGTYIASAADFKAYSSRTVGFPFRLFAVSFESKGRIDAHIELNDGGREAQPPYGWAHYQIRLFFNGRDLSPGSQLAEFLQYVSLQLRLKKESHLLRVIEARPEGKGELDLSEDTARFLRAQFYARMGYFVMELSDQLNAALPEAHHVCDGRFIHQLLELALLGE